MATMDAQFHSLISVRLADPPGISIPILLLADGQPSLTAVRFARHLVTKNFKSYAVHRHIAVLGRFYDFLYCTELWKGRTPSPGRLPLLLAQFHDARVYGAPSTEDAPELNWNRIPEPAALEEQRLLNKFCSYCLTDEAGSHPLPRPDQVWDPLFDRSSPRAYVSTGTNRFSMLSHLGPKGKAPQQGGSNGTRHTTERGRPRNFPTDKIPALIDRTTSVRDKLLWLLGAFGATRISEALNLFETDIRYTKAGTKVLLAHPKLSAFRWVDKFGRKCRGTRQDYLLAEHGLVPRSMLSIGDRLYAGWKGMVYGGIEGNAEWWESSAGWHADLFWLIPEIGHLFWRLHGEYAIQRLSFLANHPYYFISLSGPTRGEPLTVKNVQQIFERAARRVGASTTFYHSLRHFYGHFAVNFLRKSSADGRLVNLAVSEVRLMMRHRSEESTAVYAIPDLKRVKDEILKAREAARTAILPGFESALKALG